MKSEKEEIIIFMGKEVKKSVLPNIYRLAKANPKNLEASIKGMMKKQGFPTPGSAMVILESDLGY
jgi:hypothetical protein